MVDNFKPRYSENNTEWMLLNKAALLDPRFSRLVYLSPGQKHLVIESLSQELKEAECEIDGDCAQEREDVAPALGAMGSLFGDMYKSIDSANGIQELKNYMTEPPLPVDSNTLHWWRDTGCNKYPLLSKLTRKYLCVPGTSVRSKRVFSTAGNIVNKKRAALDPDQVDRLVFLANNIKK